MYEYKKPKNDNWPGPPCTSSEESSALEQLRLAFTVIHKSIRTPS